MSLATFILLLRDSTCFGHQYAYLQEYGTILLNCHIGCFVLGLQCVGVWVQIGWGGIGTQTPTHSKPRTKQPIQQYSRIVLKMVILMPEAC